MIAELITALGFLVSWCDYILKVSADILCLYYFMLQLNL